MLNVLPGHGARVGEPLALHMDVDVLAFTGSTATGAKLLGMQDGPTSSGFWLECGGKSPHLVFADAPDLDAAAKAVAQGIFFNQGEVCTAGSRLLVQRSIREDFVHQVIAMASTCSPAIHWRPMHRWVRWSTRTWTRCWPISPVPKARALVC